MRDEEMSVYVACHHIGGLLVCCHLLCPAFGINFVHIHFPAFDLSSLSLSPTFSVFCSCCIDECMLVSLATVDGNFISWNRNTCTHSHALNEYILTFVFKHLVYIHVTYCINLPLPNNAEAAKKEINSTKRHLFASPSPCAHKNEMKWRKKKTVIIL